MAYSNEIINKVLELIAKDKSIALISTILNISPSTLYRWKKNYQDKIIEIQETIQAPKKIKYLIKAGRLEAALALSEEERFQNDSTIQSQRITILIKLGKLEEALTLSEEERFQNDSTIQFQRIKILIKLGRLEEALALSEEERFQSDFPIQSQRIKVLIKLGRLEEALALSEEKRFQNDATIQSQRITILIKFGRLEEALTLCEEERFQNYFSIQSQRIIILTKLGRLEEALALSEEERFQNDFPIQSQRIAILRELGRLEEALTLCEEERFQNHLPIQSQKKHLKDTLAKNLTASSNELTQAMTSTFQTKLKLNPKSVEYNLLKNIISSCCIEEDITGSDIEEWKKVVLTIAFYEKNNYPIDLVIRYLKRQNIIYQNNKAVLSIIKKLLARVRMKRKLFSEEFYKELLRSTVINNLEEKDYLLSVTEGIINSQENPPSR